MSSNIFKPSFIEAGMYLARRYLENEEMSIKELVSTISNVREDEYDYSSVENFLNTNEVDLSIFSIEDNDFFIDDVSKNTLYKLIVLDNPIWTKNAHNGIAHILASIKSLEGGNDILQCLKNAGLLKQETGDSARWWLKIMQDSRPDDQNLMDIGTQGEDATIKYEEKYLLKESIEEEVVNIALRYPDEKYDVKSWRRDKSGKIYPIQIESKKTYQNHFYLSRNEYEAGKKFKDTYKIYYWTSDEQTEPKIIPFKKLERNIPRDKGSGVWTNVEIKPKESDFN